MSSRANAPVDFDQHVSNRIRLIRMERGLSLKEVADRVGLMFQQYHKYETGILKLSVGLLVAIADVLDCELADFFPPELQSEKSLNLEMRLDLLKQEIIGLMQETRSEQTLIALKTLLERPSEIETTSVNGTTG